MKCVTQIYILYTSNMYSLPTCFYEKLVPANLVVSSSHIIAFCDASAVADHEQLSRKTRFFLCLNALFTSFGYQHKYKKDCTLRHSVKTRAAFFLLSMKRLFYNNIKVCVFSVSPLSTVRRARSESVSWPTVAHK